MKRYPALFIKWLANRFGYKIGMIKINNAETNIEGDKEILIYFDISGYIFKKEPFNRSKKY
jgi:hypothetical protein